MGEEHGEESVAGVSSEEEGSARPELRTAVDRLRLRAHRRARSHFLAARGAHRAHLKLGIPATVLAALTSTAIFASWQSDDSSRILTAIAAVIAGATVILTSLQTFFSYADRGVKHKNAAGRFAALKRELDVVVLELDTGETSSSEVLVKLKDYTDKFNSEELSAPDVSDRLYDRARTEQVADKEGV